MDSDCYMKQNLRDYVILLWKIREPGETWSNRWNTYIQYLVSCLLQSKGKIMFAERVERQAFRAMERVYTAYLQRYYLETSLLGSAFCSHQVGY